MSVLSLLDVCVSLPADNDCGVDAGANADTDTSDANVAGNAAGDAISAG